MKSTLKNRLIALAIVGATGVTAASAQASGVDYAAAATTFKDTVLPALVAIGGAVMLVAGAIAAFRKARGLIK